MTNHAEMVVKSAIEILEFVASTTEEMRKRPEVVAQMKMINDLRAKKGEEPYEFNYVLLCNKICGASHSNMQMTVVVDTQDQYEAWLAKQKPLVGGYLL